MVQHRKSWVDFGWQAVNLVVLVPVAAALGAVLWLSRRRAAVTA